MRTLTWAYLRLREGMNRRLRTLAGEQWASRCRPTEVAILLTELCNARCLHCDIWKNRGKEDSPTVEQWKSVLSDLRRWLGPVQVVLTGGEALLRPFTVELVTHGSAIGLFVEVLTHGYWDDQSRIEALALARPWRVTVSFDGIGETHTRIRGRDNFFEKTTTTIRTLQRLRKEQSLILAIRLKTVVMRHNLDDVCQIAQFAKQNALEVFYQPIEQNYNTPEDPVWFEHSENWPRDIQKASAAVKQLIALKRQGLPIANSFAQLEVMIPYFRDPQSLGIAVQSHTAHERRIHCSALTGLQLQANGDVTICPYQRSVGNIKTTSIRDIWEHRPRWWESGCCLERRSLGGDVNRQDAMNAKTQQVIGEENETLDRARSPL